MPVAAVTHRTAVRPGHGVLHVFLTLEHPSVHDFLRAVLGESTATVVSELFQGYRLVH